MTRFTQEYKDYIKSPLWKRVRMQAIRGAHNRCEHCHKTPPQVKWLEVNHKHYRKPFGQERWPDDLEALCPPCHKKADNARRAANRHAFGRSRRLRRLPSARVLAVLCVLFLLYYVAFHFH